jgi:hypothetical protein
MQLIYPWFLVGLLSIGLPVLIHLLQLRRPQRVLFTNIGFIRQVDLVTVRQRKLQHLLVLLARVLGVVALVLMFCQPFIPAEKGAATLVTNGVDVMVDSSPSMQVRGQMTGNVFSEAVDNAREIARAFPSSARFRLINEGKTNLTEAAYQQKLDGLKVSAQRNELGKIAGIDGSQEGSAYRPLYVFSDFQKSEFKTATLAGLGQQREIILVPLLGKASGNVYVDSVWLDDAFVRVRTNVGLHVRLRNGGIILVNDCPVKVFLGQHQVAAFRVSVEPGQMTTSVVQVQVADEKLALGRVVTEDVPVTFDNTYYFTLQPAAVIPVLEIGAEPVAQHLYGNEPLFSYSFAKPQNVDYGKLRKASLVLVREIEQVDAGLREGLQAVVKRGGSVVVVPSAASSSHVSYQQLFKMLGLGTAQWESTAAPELREVAIPSAHEPFFRDVFGAQPRVVTMPRVAPVLRWARTGSDILRMRDGESYLAEFASGPGRIYVFAAPFAQAYSDFTQHALFVPVLYRMAMLSYRNEQLPAYRLTQAAVTLNVPATEGAAGRGEEASIRLVKDSLKLIPVQREQGQELRLEVPEGMNLSGFYQVQRRGKVLTTLAFNQAKQESELAAYSADELRAMVGPNQKNVRVLDGDAGGAALAKFRTAQSGQPLWRYCLVVALLCLLAEALLLRFGGQQVVRGPQAVAA